MVLARSQWEAGAPKQKHELQEAAHTLLTA